MKLFLFSGQHTQKLNKELIGLAGKKTVRISYIPSSSQSPKSADYFQSWKDTFKGISDLTFSYFPIDQPFTQQDKVDAFSADIVYLSGGDTEYFWKHIKENNLEKDLKKQANNKVLAGLSAGSIIMTKNLGTLSIIEEDCILFNKSEGLLSLVTFNFVPHYQPAIHLEKILKFQEHNSTPTVALPDNSAIMVNNTDTTLLGEHAVFCSNPPVQLI